MWLTIYSKTTLSNRFTISKSNKAYYRKTCLVKHFTI